MQEFHKLIVGICIVAVIVISVFFEQWLTPVAFVVFAVYLFSWLLLLAESWRKTKSLTPVIVRNKSELMVWGVIQCLWFFIMGIETFR